MRYGFRYGGDLTDLYNIHFPTLSSLLNAVDPLPSAYRPMIKSHELPVDQHYNFQSEVGSRNVTIDFKYSVLYK